MNQRARRWPMLLAAWLATFFGFVTVAHGDFETTDAGFTMQAARGLWDRGDSGLRLAEQGATTVWEQAGAIWIHHYQEVGTRKDGKIGENGLAYVWYPVGHVWLLVPFVALGEVLDRAVPSVEQEFRRRIGVSSHAGDGELLSRTDYLTATPVLMQGVISLLVPSLCMATSVLLLFLLARALGAGDRDAVRTALAIALCTQCFSLGREQLSDGPGLTLLLATLLGLLHVHQGRSSRLVAMLTGLAAGAGVLLRYQTALAVIAIGVAFVLACRRQRRLGDIGWFVLGGVPALASLLLVDQLRFGNPLITGYPDASDWFNQPIWVGLPKILFAAGRGILWFSPLLWLALPLAWRRRDVPQLRWLAWVLFTTPLLIFATARGWQGGQCWSVRYVTPGVVALLALVLPQALPWRRWPRTWLVLLAAGVFVNVTSVIAPVRGIIQLASQAVKADLAREVAAGQLTAAAALAIDPADVTGWQPRYTPLLANWRYALRSHVGGFEDDQGRPRHGSSNTIEPLFGITAVDEVQGHAPERWEDRCGRHLWWRFFGDLGGVSGWLLLAPIVLLALVFTGLGWWRLWRTSGTSTLA